MARVTGWRERAGDVLAFVLAAYALVTLVLLAILAALQIGSAIHESSTNDETSHLAAGYAYLTTGEYSMELKHPPLEIGRAHV